jgi:hypothetical protein
MLYMLDRINQLYKLHFVQRSNSSLLAKLDLRSNLFNRHISSNPLNDKQRLHNLRYHVPYLRGRHSWELHFLWEYNSYDCRIANS